MAVHVPLHSASLPPRSRGMRRDDVALPECRQNAASGETWRGGVRPGDGPWQHILFKPFGTVRTARVRVGLQGPIYRLWTSFWEHDDQNSWQQDNTWPCTTLLDKLGAALAFCRSTVTWQASSAIYSKSLWTVHSSFVIFRSVQARQYFNDFAVDQWDDDIHWLHIWPFSIEF